MSAATEFDLGPLTWVKGEIDLALQRAGESLERFEAERDPTQLRFCRTHVHQVHGALAMVGLEGITQLTESLELLLTALEDGTVADAFAALSAARLALLDVQIYLDELLAGAPHQPLRLLPAAQSLAQARGEPPLHPSELFFPDLTRRPPKRSDTGPLPDVEAQRQLFKAERLRFQKGLLGWLKKPDEAEAGRCMMRDAVAAIEAVETTPAARTFWWVARAFLDALADPVLAGDPFARQLCSRIDAQIRRLLEGSASVAERVLREALYYVAQAPASLSSGVAEVQQVFALAALLPARMVTSALAQPQAAALRKLRDTLASAEVAWSKFCTGQAASLSGFVGDARRIAQLTEESGQTDFKRLGQGLGAVANWLADEPARHGETVAIEVATAILLLQEAQEHFAGLGTDFAQQVDAMVARLYACISGRALSDTTPQLDALAHKARERLLIGQVGRDIQSHLAQIEQTLDAFFRDPSKRQELARLDAPLAQIGGSLAMLGHFPAVNHLKACQARIQGFLASDSPPAAEEFEPLAAQLSLLGFFVDALAQGEKDFAAFARRMQGETSAGEAEAPTVSVEAQLDGLVQDTRALAGALRAAPEETGLRDEVKAKLQAMQKDADLVGRRELAEAARASLAALQAGEPLAVALAAWLPAAPEAEASAPEIEQAKEAGASDVDAELLAIFLEEACDVLATMGEQKALLAADPANLEALTTIRRSTHTLKGSGRMVGLVDLGETAWQLEQALNLWLRQDLPATPELLDMVEQEHALFTHWVGHLEHGGPAPEAGALIALAARLRGEDVPEPVVASAAAVEVSLPVPESPIEAPSTRVELPEVELPPPLEMPGVEALAPEVPEALEALLLEGVGQGTQQAAREQTLYDVFRTEASGHLLALLDGLAALTANPQAPTSFEMARAAHTLGGIAGTVRLWPLHHLGLALEDALLRRDASAPGEREAGLDIVRQAIGMLEAMFDGLAVQHEPEEQPALLAALAEVFPPAPAEPLPVSAEIIALPGVDRRPALPEAAAPIDLAVLLSDELDEQLLPLFLDEASDQLGQLDMQLRAWRGELGGLAAPQAIARLLHTFKGNARMAGAMHLGELTHLLESRVEEALRAGAATPGFIDEIQAGCDTLAQAVEQLRGGKPLPGAEASGELPHAVDHEIEAETGGAQALLRVRADLVDRLVNEAGEVSIARTRIEGEMRSLKASLLDLTENVIRLRRQLREIEIQAESQIQARTAQSGEGHADFDPLELDRFTRFQELTRFMAESVNDVATVQQSLLKNLDDANAAIVAQARLNRSLQQALMSVRMLPFDSQAERLYRIVRQTAKELGKRANLEIVGGQVEVDRSVLERMQAPLEHMLRNAVTHGIEAVEQRLAVDKPEAGEITIRLTQEGNEIILSISDDGRGLDLESIRARAEALGLLEAGQAVDAEVLQALVFRPGFSTASELTQVSGRGVGMDVVRSEVAALGGRIEIQSEPGQGTSFRLYLPLTLAVTQTVLVRVGNQSYAIPSTMVEQVLELKESALAELRAKGEADWQGNRYPYHFLPHLLGDGAAVPEAHRRYWVLLLRSGTHRIALQVDELSGNQEVVVKNIGAQLARVGGIEGATVLGDGQVVLIINPVTLAGRVPAADLSEAQPLGQAVAPALHLPTVMVVDDSLTVRKITSRLLMREGYQVLLAKDGVDALEQLGDLIPDVILSDIEMPRMDGFDFVRNLRADERLRGIPVIMITSRTADKHRNYALEIGANHYLGKPYDEDELLGLVAGYARR